MNPFDRNFDQLAFFFSSEMIGIASFLLLTTFLLQDKKPVDEMKLCWLNFFKI